MAKYRVKSELNKRTLQTWYHVQKKCWWSLFWSPVGQEKGLFTEVNMYRNIEDAEDYLKRVKSLKV